MTSTKMIRGRDFVRVVLYLLKSISKFFFPRISSYNIAQTLNQRQFRISLYIMRLRNIMGAKWELKFVESNFMELYNTQFTVLYKTFLVMTKMQQHIITE